MFVRFHSVNVATPLCSNGVAVSALLSDLNPILKCLLSSSRPVNRGDRTPLVFSSHHCPASSPAHRPAQPSSERRPLPSPDDCNPPTSFDHRLSVSPGAYAGAGAACDGHIRPRSYTGAAGPGTSTAPARFHRQWRGTSREHSSPRLRLETHVRDGCRTVHANSSGGGGLDGNVRLPAGCDVCGGLQAQPGRYGQVSVADTRDRGRGGVLRGARDGKVGVSTVL